MSCLFQAGEIIVWDPSNTVARLFTGQAGVLASVLGCPSGIGDIVEDECMIDLPAFEAFLGAATARYHETTHPILRSLTIGFIATALVLLDRAGGELPVSESMPIAEWIALRDEHARSMPR